MVEYIRSRSPLRIGLAGGGTDVDPYASEKGGCVFNTTINKYAYCTITPRHDSSMMSVRSLYYGRYQVPLDGGPLKLDGNMDLIKAVTNYFKIKQGCDVFIHSDVPAGSGLGGSSSMMVAMISAVANWLEQDISPNEIAHLAYKLERGVIGLKGGTQDQYASAFGGFNLMDIDSSGVRVTPIKLDADIVNELQYRSVLCFTGTSRESAEIIGTQIDSFKKGDNQIALDESKRLAREICHSLQKSDIDEAARGLDQSWEYKKQFSDKISNPQINRLYDVAKKNGAIGGKVSGAGGGGFMYFICEYDKKTQVAQELHKSGAVMSGFMFDPNGVTSWRNRNE